MFSFLYLQLAFGPIIWPLGPIAQSVVGEMAYKPLPRCENSDGVSCIGLSSHVLDCIMHIIGLKLWLGSANCVLANCLAILTKYGLHIVGKWHTAH